MIRIVLYCCVALFSLMVAVAILVLLADRSVESYSNGLHSRDLSDVPRTRCALVLGTSKYLPSGKLNPYFRYRMDAAERLYRSGRVKHIVVSGDNSTRNYNETNDMFTDLVERGVPAESITRDYAGFRTLDSVVRMREVFGQDNFIIVSQPFHNQRAIFLAGRKGMTAYGYDARDVAPRLGFRTMVREKFARVKAYIDIIAGKHPKFYGDPVPIPEDDLSI